MGATTNVTLDSLTNNVVDGDGILCSQTRMYTNFQVKNSSFTNNFDGIEFYGNASTKNMDIINSLFKGSAGNRSGIVVNAANEYRILISLAIR